MKKGFILFGVLLVLSLSACGAKNTGTAIDNTVTTDSKAKTSIDTT